MHCPNKGRKSVVHNAVRDELVALCLLLKIHHAKEYKSGFNGYSEFKDADVAILRQLPEFIPPGYTGPPLGRVAIDVKSVGHATNGGCDTELGNRHAATMAKNVIARNANQDFYFSSFTFNCHGALHTEAYRLLASLAKLGSQGLGRWMGDEKGCLRMIQRRISIAIARAFASNIINSVTGLLHAAHSSDPDAAPTRCFNWIQPRG
jgi:hypothetical protein